MKLVIFDCDGTLVDSEFLCNLAMEQQLAELGFEVDAAHLTSEFRGVNLAEIMKSLASRLEITFADDFEVEYRKKVLRLFDQHLKANDGVIELIESLTIPFCIASSAPRTKIEHALKVTGLDKYFTKERTFSAHEVGVWKPEPDLFLHAAKTMKVEPANCYVIEDSLVGVQAANRAKMQCIYFAPGFEDKNPLASVQVEHMSQLLGKLI
jgi:HAD superfamily hydrolase (TIGR01509 family)